MEENRAFWVPRSKTMQNHPEIISNFAENFDEKSEVGHVHVHQKLQVRAKPSRKTYTFFYWPPKAPIEGETLQTNNAFV